MALSIFYVFLALMGLGVLIFIHELGHYFMAKRVGMKVEVFSIGFGKAIYSWKRKKVRWQIGILPIGGYVKIAGMQEEKGKDPYKIAKGFFSKKPIDRIKVALMGPLANIIFAFVVFSLIWVTGGRKQSFSRYTQYIGWVEPSSQLYQLGVHPGDMITTYGGRKFHNFQDLYYASVLKGDTTPISGVKIDYFHHTQVPFDYTLSSYPHPMVKGMGTIGVMAPASYLLYDHEQKMDPSLWEHSPMKNSGIAYGDRIVWVNGQLVFSLPQLRSIINKPSAFVTVERNGQLLSQSIPVLMVRDVKMEQYDREEIDDWKHEAGIQTKIADLRFFPFYFNEDLKVENHYSLIDQELEKSVRNNYTQPLKRGDRIVAINGIKVRSASALLEELQIQKALIIVHNDPSLITAFSYRDVDARFIQNFDIADVNKVIGAIGTEKEAISGNTRLLAPVVPQTYAQLISSSALPLSKELHKDKTLFLGIALRDRQVRYNPNPFVLYKNVFSDMGRVFSGLFTGTLHPKKMSGAVGIVQVFHHSWRVGIKEALYWLGVISINLGIINLFPIPVFDGGHILFSLIEMITRKKLKIKTMEKLILPFVFLLIAAFIYITYHDIMRLIENWTH